MHGPRTEIRGYPEHAPSGACGLRQAAALVHGELGPDHVLLDRRGEPVLIDIEGATYFDVEAEHVWMRMAQRGG
jgi:aminoglycoside phosphotransferase (APT) family kinase protein